MIKENKTAEADFHISLSFDQYIEEQKRSYLFGEFCSESNGAVVVGQRSIKKTGFSMARTLEGQLYMEEDRESRDGILRIYSKSVKNNYYTNRHPLHCLKPCKKQKNKPEKHTPVKTPCFDKKTGCNKLTPYLQAICPLPEFKAGCMKILWTLQK